MKIIEGMRQYQNLLRKIDDLKQKVAKNCADYDANDPEYETVENQREKIKEWMQAISDSIKEVMRLKVAIQRTNLETEVVVILDEKSVKKTLAEWVYRRRELAKLELSAWQSLTNKSLVDQAMKDKDGNITITKVRKYYDQEKKDDMVELFKSEPLLIDAQLEIANSTTDLIE